jgi:adenylate cyclase
MPEALPQHDAILRDAVESTGGLVVKTTGDGFLAAFGRAEAALMAALAAQRALAAATWGKTCSLWVRMGLHTGMPSFGRSTITGRW